MIATKSGSSGSRLPIKKRMFVVSNKRTACELSCNSFQSNHPSPAGKRCDATSFANPVDFVKNVLERKSLNPEAIASKADAKFLQPTEERMKSYTETTRFLRDNNLAGLKQLQQAGIPMDSCNRFGDSLIHIACRRGMTSIVKFLVEEAKCSLYVRDDFLRTPLHDACWTPEPNFDIVETLLRVSPDLVLLRDSRGATPLDYIRASHKEQWVEFLATREELLLPT